MEQRLVVFADDATGANASAGALAQSLGRPVPVMDHLGTASHDIVVLNTKSREDPSRVGLIIPWARDLWRAGHRHFDKRIDTTLRGPAPEELENLCHALPQKPWVGVVAAYPDAARSTRGGRQWVGDQLARDVVDIASDDVGKYLFGQGGCLYVNSDRYTESALASELLNSPDPVIFDAFSNHHLAQVAAIIRLIRQFYPGPVVTVSSGALFCFYPAGPPARTLIIVGSPTMINLQQVAYLQKHYKMLTWPLDQPLTQADASSLPVIILHSGLTPVEARNRQDLSSLLAERAVTRLEELSHYHWVPQRFILTGGEMAQSFLDHVQATGTQMAGFAAPLVGHGWIDGGRYSGIEIMTKGGMVGAHTLLFELASRPSLSSRITHFPKEDVV